MPTRNTDLPVNPCVTGICCLHPASALLRQIMLLACLSMAAAFVPVRAQSTTAPVQPQASLRYDIPAGTLDQALNHFAADAGITLSIDGALTADKHSSGLSGSYSVPDGLKALLAGTGLEAVATLDSGYVIRPATAATITTSGTVLPTVTVAGHRAAIDEAPPLYKGGQVGSGARMGVLGNTAVMDTPFSVTSYSAQVIENNQARSVADIAAMDPSVRMSSARSNINEDLTMRGFAVSSADFALNGLFGLTPYWRAPLESIERVEVIKGPSAALFGMAPGSSVGGVINLVPKRAGDIPLMRITAGITSNSLFGGHADIGGRFGPDNVFGARLNVMHRGGNTTIDGQSTYQSLGSLGLDFRQRSLRASLDLLWQQERINNVVRQFQLNPGLTAVPRVPDNTTAYPGFGWTDGRNISWLFKAEYDISQAVTAYASYGMRKLNWGAIAANPVLLNTAGDYSYAGGWQRMPTRTQSLEAGMRGVFATGPVSHSTALGFTWLDQSQELGFYTGLPPGISNLYTGQLFSTPSIEGINNLARPYLDTQLTSVVLADTMSFWDDRLLASLGLRYQKVEGQSYNFATGMASGPRYDKSAITPVVGIVFKLRPSLSLYASYIEGLSKGDTAPISAAITNPGEIMSPYKSKQKEIGVKFDQGNFMTTLSLFELTRPSAGISGTTFGVFGEQRNRGVEATIAGEVVRGVRVLGGASYIDAVLSKSVSAMLKGNKAIGVPEWQANLGAEWDVGFLPGLTLTGRMVYTAKTFVNATNTLKIPDWVRFDAGVRYAARIVSKPVMFRLNVENLFDKDYFGAATAGYLFIGTPRTINFSASIDL